MLSFSPSISFIMPPGTLVRPELTPEEQAVAASAAAIAAGNPALQPPAGMMQGADPDMDAKTAFVAWILSKRDKKGNFKGDTQFRDLNGKSEQEIQAIAPSLWDKADDTTKNNFRATSQGEAPGQTGVPQLPEAFRNMPNAPNLSGPAAQVDPMTGRLTKAGASPGAAAAYQGMAEQQETRKATAKAAVAATQAAQVANVAGVVDRSRAARANEQAKSGIVDMGGGNMTLNNKYGSGFSTRSIDMSWKGGLKPGMDVPGYGKIVSVDPTTGATFENGVTLAPKSSGVIRDENGVVDMKKSSQNGTIVNTPGNPENLPTRAESMGTIAQGQAALAPGAADRLAADRNRQVAQAQATVDANMGKPAGPGSPALPPALQSLPSLASMAPSSPMGATAAGVMGSTPSPTAMPPVRNIMPPPPVAAAPAPAKAAAKTAAAAQPLPQPVARVQPPFPFQMAGR